jgi:hypothetical protein
MRFAYRDEPTWFLLAFIAVELVAVIVLLAVLVAR